MHPTADMPLLILGELAGGRVMPGLSPLQVTELWAIFLKGEMPGPESDIECRTGPAATNGELNSLFAVAWREHTWRDFGPVLDRSLTYVCAYYEERLVGFVNLAWDGGYHAFILDTTVHPDFRRRGIGRELVRRAIAEAEGRGVEWVHVDYERHLLSFYEQCGFVSTPAGLVRLEGRKV
ncbi:MAG TPA: GNAT family N-acetyltransferase [Pyrinomonadaceae bacterium]